MKTFETMKNEKFYIKLLAIGDIGSGKTFLSLTFPKCYVINTDPGGLDTILTNPELRKNLVGWEDFIPQNAQDTKPMFEKMIVSIKEAKAMALKGEVETLVIDSMTSISELRWIYTNQFEQETSLRTGNIDTQSMYGKLSRWLYGFTFMDIMSFPGNVVVTALEQLESDEALEKKPDKSTPVLASILGGFRDKIGAMFSSVFFLTKIKGQDGQYHFYARCDKGNLRNAKNRFNLREIIEDVSYSVINKTIQEALQKGI